MSKYEIQTNMKYFGCMGVGIYFSNQWLSSFVDSYWVLWICFLYVVVDLLYYMCNVYVEIADHLKIRIFSIQKNNNNNSTSEETSKKNERVGVRTRSQVKKLN